MVDLEFKHSSVRFQDYASPWENSNGTLPVTIDSEEDRLNTSYNSDLSREGMEKTGGNSTVSHILNKI